MLAPAGATGKVSTSASTNILVIGICCEPASNSWSPSKAEINSSDSGETNSPQTLCRGRMPFSSCNTRAPPLAAVIAAADPAGPPPITTRSNVLLMFPRNRCHAEQVMRRDLHPLRFTFFEKPSHFILRIGTPDRHRSIVSGQSAAHKRHCYIDECEVHRVTAQVIDQHGALGDTQRLVRELGDLLRL